MKKALFIENAFWSSAGTQGLKKSLFDAAKVKNLEFIVRSNADFLKQDSYLNLPGHALFWDKDIKLAQLLELSGMRLYNSAKAISLCDDKTSTYIALKDSGLPMPDTLICPATFENIGFTNFDFINDAADRLGFPFVLKAGRGSFGSQVYLPQGLQEARAILEQCVGEPMLFQRFIQESSGRDVRVYVVHGQAVAAIRRENHDGDFRANIARGGSAYAHQVSDEEKKLALTACHLLSLDFAGVDILFSKDGPLLCEVNSNAHFKALHELTGINPADNIVQMIAEDIN